MPGVFRTSGRPDACHLSDAYEAAVCNACGAHSSIDRRLVCAENKAESRKRRSAIIASRLRGRRTDERASSNHLRILGPQDGRRIESRITRGGKFDGAKTLLSDTKGRQPASLPRSRDRHEGEYGRTVRALMSHLMSDRIDGRITPSVGNAVCNAGGKLLKVVEMQQRWGTPKTEGGPRDLQLTGTK